MTPYRSIRELAQQEPKQGAYRIDYRRGASGIAIMAIHGGGIEPGTTEIADAVADRDHSFYSFTGTKPNGNWRLHISSRCFDEPIGRRMAETARIVVTIHGCQGSEAGVYLGGRHHGLKRAVSAALEAAGFSVAADSRFPGKTRQNICNRGRSGRGVQMELTRELRNSFFFDLSYAYGRSWQKPPFTRFVSVVRSVLTAEL
ncbi:MAG: poly-gamma-glutamate hydrolase family protein [Desulfobacterales bacterium]|nr:poly-gamma-glutamate hydrolase family protein [Desulfobacterales bacterium]